MTVRIIRASNVALCVRRTHATLLVRVISAIAVRIISFHFCFKKNHSAVNHSADLRCLPGDIFPRNNAPRETSDYFSAVSDSITGTGLTLKKIL